MELTDEEFEKQKKEGKIKEETLEDKIAERALALSKEDFEKCQKINEAISKFSVEPNYKNEKDLANYWYVHTHKYFKNISGPYKLTLKEGMDGSLLPFHLWAIKLDKNKPYLFLIIEQKRLVMIDERRFDAFDRGPFIKPE